MRRHSWRLWLRLRQSSKLDQPTSLIYDALVTVGLAILIGSLLQAHLLSADNLPTGGDTASHVLYAKAFQQEMLPSWRLTGWMPEVFAGFPLLSYYFPLPFLAAALLGQGLGFAAGLKWAMVLPSLLLPGTVFALSRHALRLPTLAAWAAALGSLAFLLHEQNAIWGGNLLSVLAGEFAYSWGMWLALMGMATWWRAARQPERAGAWLLPAVVEAMTGLSHGYPLLWLGSASFILLLEGRPWRPVVMLLLKGHLAAFALLGGWLWPLLEMHPYTIANDAATPIPGLADALPSALWPVVGAGMLGCMGLWLRSRASSVLGMTANRFRVTRLGRSETGLLWFGALASAWAVCASLGAERVGLLDVRFLPLAWLFGAIIGGWAVGLWLQGFGAPVSRAIIGLAMLCGLLAWLDPRVRTTPVWAEWNHSGLEGKPQWQVLSRLLPFMAGTLASPRLLFEHDPANQDLGSTRVLEALPMFLGGRPVLEGLYMESALLGPAIYQLQSEVSARPSSPLVRFPSGRLNPAMAATHMRMLYANQVLLRSSEATRALIDSELFILEATAGPFSLLRLKDFNVAMVEAMPRPWVIKPREEWMLDSYRWFRSARQILSEWPVYADTSAGRFPIDREWVLNHAGVHAGQAQKDHAEPIPVDLSRDRIRFKATTPRHPHLIKMAFHPRWELRTPGELWLAAPGFMLVVPDGDDVELVYGTTWIGRAGEAATLFALSWVISTLVLVAWRARHRSAGSTPANLATSAGLYRSAIINWWTGSAALVIVAAALAVSSPGIAYFDAWDAYREGRYKAASKLFAEAHAGRRSPAGQEEALFWAAKAAEASGDAALALSRFTRLVETYHGYWLEESLRQVVRLSEHAGDAATAKAARTRLQAEFENGR